MFCIMVLSLWLSPKDAWAIRAFRLLSPGDVSPTLRENTWSTYSKSVRPCCYRFRGGRNGVWVSFSRRFFRFPLRKISFRRFSTLTSIILFHDGVTGMFSRHPWYLLAYTIGAPPHLIPRPDPVSEKSWWDLYHHHHHHHRDHHQSVPPKGRCFTANSGTKAAVLLKGRSSTVNSGTKFIVLVGMNRCGSFPLLSVPYSLFSVWTDLKRSEKIPGAPA